jgi:hypothetical protein
MKQNPCLGWEIFKIESKQMREICFPKFGNIAKTLVMHYVANYDFCKVKMFMIFQ